MDLIDEVNEGKRSFFINLNISAATKIVNISDFLHYINNSIIQQFHHIRYLTLSLFEHSMKRFGPILAIISQNLSSDHHIYRNVRSLVQSRRADTRKLVPELV